MINLSDRLGFTCLSKDASRYELLIDVEATVDERQRMIVYDSLYFLTLAIL